MRIRIRVVWVLVLVLIISNSSHGAAPEVIAVIDRYVQSLSWQTSATWELKSHFETSAPASARQINKQEDHVSFARDGNRIVFDVTSTTFAEKRIPPAITKKTISIANGSQFMWAKPDPKTGEFDRIFVETQTDSLVRRDMAAFLGCVGGYLSGFGDRGLDQVLREAASATLRTKTEKVDKHTCSVIDAAVPEGNISAWFANDADGALVKLTIRSDENSTFGGKRLTELKTSDRGKEQLTGIGLTLDSVQLSEISGRYIPTHATVVRESIFKDGKDGRTERRTTVYDLSNIQLNPDFSKLHCFELKAPDGTPVTDLENQHNGIKYVWKDAKVQIGVDDSDQQKIDAGLGLAPKH